MEDFVEFERFSVFSTCELDQEQAVELIDKLDYESGSKQRFMDALNEKLYKKHRSFASNPLLLTMMFLTYDESGSIPEKIHLFYEQAFEALFSRHDRRKGGYVREWRSGLARDSFKLVFASFCCKTYYHNKLEFTHDDLIVRFRKIKADSGIEFEPENI